MREQVLYAAPGGAISDEQLRLTLEDALSDCRDRLGRVLLLVPDYTRFHSNAGRIANLVFHMLDGERCHVDLLPALGTHLPMSDEQIDAMYGADIPKDRFLVHNWRTGVVKIGQVPASFVTEVSGGQYNEAIDVEVSKYLYDGYDLILSVGQVVPHEVVGMANHTKNIFVGCGGLSMISGTHLLGAIYGMENMMGRDFSPVRKVFDYANEHFLKDLSIWYALTVTTAPEDEIRMHGLFIGQDRSFFEKAVALSLEKNMNFLDRPIRKAVVLLDGDEFKSTWIGNKATYRVCMAMADGGELIILAPGIEMFGEDPENDAMLRKYGYCGREKILKLHETEADLQANPSVTAHIIFGSPTGRFSITFCPGHLGREEVEAIGFGYIPYEEAAARYDPKVLKDGYNTMPDGEEIFYISKPALGLWANRDRF